MTRSRLRPIARPSTRACIWTPDKDLAQCVVGDRVVQVDRRSGAIRTADGVREKFGVDPLRIPDYLALVGDSADGYPGIAGIGAKTAARLIARHGPIEEFPDDVLGAQRGAALLFKRLATLRTDVPVFDDVEAMRWRGPTADFPAIARALDSEGLIARLVALAAESPPGHPPPQRVHSTQSDSPPTRLPA